MNDSFAEYRDVSISEPLRQGDVLEAVDPNAAKWQRHLLVITADCDFANHKNQGRVTCVPLLTAEEYLMEMQLPKLREKLVKKPLSALQTILSASGIEISESRLREWVDEEGTDSILSSLELDGTNGVSACRAVESIRMLDASPASLKEGIDSLINAQLAGLNPPSPRNAKDAVLRPLKEAYRQPPGDALFLTALAPAHDVGYFVYLRHLEQVWEPEISTGPTRRDVRYRRISRFQDRFTHALVQRFAAVFTSIGLPKEYEDMRDLHAEILGDVTS